MKQETALYIVMLTKKRIAKLVEYYLDKNNQTGVQFQLKNT